MEIEAENAHFQPSVWGFSTMKHSRRFANDVALAFREKILAGMDFRVANRLWADNGRNRSVQPWLRLRTFENTENTEFPKRCNKLQKAQEYTRGESFLFTLLNES